MLFEYYVTTKPIKKVMSKSKLKHSKRVANNTKYMIYSEDVYNSALYHDFIEKGGDTNILKSIVSEYSFQLIDTLTHNIDDDVLSILKTKLIGKNTKFVNDIIIIKLSDRADNIKRKSKEGILTKKYVQKSVELIQYLYDNFIGDKDKLKNFIENKILPYHKKFSNEIIF